MTHLLAKIATFALSVTVAILGFFHLQIAQPVPPPHLGVAVPSVTQFFQDSLASAITSSQTTMTLVTGNDQSGNAIVGYYGFVIDEGTSIQEVVVGTASGTAITAMTRGLDPIKGQTATTALQFAHRRGASVKITTSPWILIVSQILNGSSTLPNFLQYSAHPVAPASTTLADVNYVNTVATSGAADAGIGSKGLVQLSTQAQAQAGATSTSDGANSLFYVVPTQWFNQTSTATTTVPVTNASGTLSPGFIAQDASSSYSFLGSVRITSSTITNTSTFAGAVISTATTTVGVLSQNTSGSWSTTHLENLANQTSNIAVSSTYTSVVSTTLPAMSNNMEYFVSGVLTLSTSANASTTILIGNQSLGNCDNVGTANSFYFGSIKNLGSSSSFLASISVGNSANPAATPNTALCTLNWLGNVGLSTSTVITIQGRTSAASITATGQLDIMGL